MGAAFSSARSAFSPHLQSPPSFPKNPVSKMDRLFEQPLNGLTVKRKGTGGEEVEGTVVSSTIRGRPTQDTPFVASEYLVEWMDGRIESGLSREAVLKMSQNRWTSSAWADAFFETHDVPVAPLEVLGAPSTSTSYRTPAGAKTSSSTKPKLAAHEPSPVAKNLIGAGISASLAGRPQLYVTQDKSKIGCAIPGHPDAIKREQQRASALAVSAAAAAAAAAAGKAAAGKAAGTAPKAAAAGAASQAAQGSSKGQGKKESSAGKKKRKAKKDESDVEESDPEPEEEEEVQEEGGDGEVPEFMRRQYPRDMTFTEGDTPLSVYKNQEEDPDAEFEIQKIVDETVYGRQKYVLVKWQGYELDVTDWSLIADVKHTDIYKEWSKKRKADERQKKKGKTE